MSTFEILNRWTKTVMFSGEYETQRAAVEAAIRRHANLGGANLSDADLNGAYLSHAYLGGADLSGADLSRANLSRVNMNGAYLSRADLSGANLSDADLNGANLSDADLNGAYLNGAYLGGADLSGADLNGANLSRANLSRANLSGANLGDGLRIMQIGGSRDFVAALRTGDTVEVRIGCQHHALDWWLEHYRAIGRENDYSAEQIVEYGRHLAYVQEWSSATKGVAK